MQKAKAGRTTSSTRLDYGRKNDYLKAYNADGSEIPLATAADLYRFLVAKQANKHT